MWIVTMYNKHEDNELDVVAVDHEALMDILSYIRLNNDFLELLHVEQRWLVYDLESLKEIIKKCDNGEI